jgi:hypothetical protein
VFIRRQKSSEMTSIVIVFCLLSIVDEIYVQHISRLFPHHHCQHEHLQWTAWFNTQQAIMNNGKKIEDFALIRQAHVETAHCQSIVNIEYVTGNSSIKATATPSALINTRGVACLDKSASPCSAYTVRLCCSVKTRRIRTNSCGQTFWQPHIHSSWRIVNGLESVPHSLPWTVSLEYKGVHDCGGVILDQWTILTAAHCLDYGNDLRNYYARIGAHNRLLSGQLMPIARLYLHPNYNEQRSTDDIGIVKLAAPITFTKEIQPICLAEQVRLITRDSFIRIYSIVSRLSNHN